MKNKRLLLYSIVQVICMINIMQIHADNPYCFYDGFRYLLNEVRHPSSDVQYEEKDLEYYFNQLSKADASACLMPRTFGQSIGSYYVEGDIRVPMYFENEGVTYCVTMMESSFYKCNKITHIELPNTINIIYNGAFYGCTELESIELPFLVSNLSGQAFNKCSSLKKIILPKYLQDITGYGLCFEGCNALEKVICPAILPPKIREKEFPSGVYNNAILYVPEESIPDYMNATGWQNFSQIKSISEYSEDPSDGDETTSVKSVKDNNQRISVFDFYGNKVLDTTNHEQIKNLDKGIYIINGKKHIIK